MKNCNNIRFLAASILLLLLNTPNCRAQLDLTVFEEFSSAIVHPYLINPSSTDTSYRFKIRVNNLSQLGIIKNVNRFYVDGDKRIGSSRPHAYHFVGLQAYNSKLGDYIFKTRMHLRYSWLTPLTEHASLSSGVSLGFINYSFLTTHGGTGGSDYAPDGTIGIHYLSKKTTIGVSIQQVFPAVLIPVSQSFQLRRLYNLDVAHRFDLGPRIDIKPYAMLQHSDQKNLLYTVGLLSRYFETVILGINNFSLRKTSVNVGVEQIPLLGSEFMLLITYSAYHSTFPLPDSTLEVYIALQK